ncbi:uncharacterized protein [Ptychodera flava]|uniref:uncharacterized protein isoform X2 n=1 Tax=Ptychodera flava TaxID=63121 RepID=UPI00396A3BC2
MFAGNFQLAVCILLSGNSHKKFELLCKFLNLACISVTSFQRIQRLYAVPAIQNYWDNMERDILDSYQGQKAILCGDGRNDSPGHSAHYLSYSLADANKNCIVHTEVVDVREVNGKSPNMERLGFERSMDKLKRTIEIDEVVTDAHVQIAAVMRKCDKYKDIKHSWDLWHGGKNIHRKVIEASKAKNCKDLLPWAAAVRNHFWYAAREANGSEIKMKAYRLLGVIP